MMQAPLALPCDQDGFGGCVETMVDIKSLDVARGIVKDDTRFMPPTADPHLHALSKPSDLDLDDAITIARNAMFLMSGERHAVLRQVVAGQLGGNRLNIWRPQIDAAVEELLSLCAPPRYICWMARDRMAVDGNPQPGLPTWLAPLHRGGAFTAYVEIGELETFSTLPRHRLASATAV
jgi:hypothetical protein